MTVQLKWFAPHMIWFLHFNTSNVTVQLGLFTPKLLHMLISIHQMWRFSGIDRGGYERYIIFQYIKCDGSAYKILAFFALDLHISIHQMWRFSIYVFFTYGCSWDISIHQMWRFSLHVLLQKDITVWISIHQMWRFSINTYCLHHIHNKFQYIKCDGSATS